MRWLLLLVLGSWLTAPAHAGLFDDKEARDLISRQQKEIEDLTASRKALEERISKLEASLLTLLNQNEQMTIELSKLRGQLEVSTNGLDNAAKRQKDMYVDLDSRLRRIEEGVGGGAGNRSHRRCGGAACATGHAVRRTTGCR